MKKFKKFYFKKFYFDLDSLKSSFFYSFDNEIFFEEKIYFNNSFLNTREDLNQNIINNLCFHLHIALGISYYKLFPTNNLIVESGFLDKDQIFFWKKFYSNGMGEFLYKNKIYPQNLFNFTNSSGKKFKKILFDTSSKILLPIGGGKDSIVSIELLKKAGLDFDTFVLGNLDKIKKSCIKISGKKNINIKRKLSENLFKLNKTGYYNGHIPITGIIAFILELVAYIYDYKYLVLSNERSANYGNFVWEGLNINHQYSKSIEFEKDFNSYVGKYISSQVKYFSLLRGFYELKIGELFSSLGKKYFKNFSSCNNNFKINPKYSLLSSSTNSILKKNQKSIFSLFYNNKKEDKNLDFLQKKVGDNLNDGGLWCLKCAKCAFVFCILRPFLSRNEIISIFSKDLYEEKKLEYLFRELLGISGHKPFECVGESQEVILSMFLSLEKEKNFNIPFMLKLFKNEVLPKLENKYIEDLKKKILYYFDDGTIPRKINRKFYFLKDL